MKKHLSALLLAGVASLHAAWAGPTALYDGADLPTAQGWTQTGGQGQVEVGSGTTRFKTTTLSGSRVSQYNMYQYAVGSANIIASIKLRAFSVSAHNSLDAGLMFAVVDAFNPPFGGDQFRSNMLYFENTRVGWADNSGTPVPVNAGEFHEYAIRYVNGQLSVFIDATYADIISGAATPVLTRTLEPIQSNAGVIVFGDQTNDSNVDSDYEVDFVNFQNLDVPDAPTSISAVGGDGSLRVSFMQPDFAGASAITGYTVGASTQGGTAAGACTPTPALPATGETASCTITGLENGQAHTVSVTANNAAGSGSEGTATATPAALATNLPLSLTSGGTATINIGGNPPGCTLSQAPAIGPANLAGAPLGAQAPLGALAFAATQCPGATLSVRIDYPAGSLSGLAPYKFAPRLAGEAASWFAHGIMSGDSVTYTITDNGVGDNNTTAGAIDDPFAPLALAAVAPAATPTAVPSMEAWGLMLLSGLLAFFANPRLRRVRS
ncbi:fibronectin type III domain-containing protein [Ottowia thiooxydans]|uniref:Fibronectin type-III domain-containing protein n=1 Tax=Ottowia thiooxydans TaxID=219182 RepID=A0ABV2QH72_9BURK